MELAKGRRWRRGPLSVARIASGDPGPAVAFAISRRVGNAVVRNRLRRRLREILRQSDLPGGSAYLFGAAPEAANASHAELRQHVDRLVEAMRNEPKVSETRPRRVRRALTWTIRGYQKLSVGAQPRCRYLPTCSEYAIEAIDTHGVGRGGWLAIRRLGRCHPWGGTGFDPVPHTNMRSSTALSGAHTCERTHP